MVTALPALGLVRNGGPSGSGGQISGFWFSGHAAERRSVERKKRSKVQTVCRVPVASMGRGSLARYRDLVILEDNGGGELDGRTRC